MQNALKKYISFHVDDRTSILWTDMIGQDKLLRIFPR